VHEFPYCQALHFIPTFLIFTYAKKNRTNPLRLAQAKSYKMKSQFRVIIAIIIAIQLTGGCYSPQGEYNAEFTLEVPVINVIKDLSGNSRDSVFIESLRLALEKQETRNWDFVTLFGESLEEVAPGILLSSIFMDKLKDQGITVNSTNEEVISALRNEIKDVTQQSMNIASKRLVDLVYTLTAMNLEADGNKIHVVLTGIDDPGQAKALLTTKGECGFWETFRYAEIYGYFMEANTRLRTIMGTENYEKKEPASKQNDEGEAVSSDDKTLLDQLEDEQDQTFEEYAKQNPLNAYLSPAIFQGDDGQYYPGESATVGYAKLEDTARVNSMLRLVSVVFPDNMELVWSVKPAQSSSEILELYALKVTSHGSPALGGDVISDARQDYDANKNVEVSIRMDSTGARAWRRITGENIDRQIAIVLDNYVYSCPTVRSEIPNGMSSISGGDMTLQEAQGISIILNSGPFPYALDLIDEKVSRRE